MPIVNDNNREPALIMSEKGCTLLIKLLFKSFAEMCKKKGEQKSQSIYVSAFCNVAPSIKRAKVTTSSTPLKS